MRIIIKKARSHCPLQESKKQAKQWFKQKKAAPEQIKAFFKYLDDEMVGHLGTGKDDVQKYIGWLVTKYGFIKDTGHIALDNDKMYEDSKGAIWNLSSALKSLHDYATYIERNIIKGKDADVGRKSFKEIVALNKPASEVVSRSQERELAKKGASIVFDDDNFFAVRPDTEEASCLFGRNTRWCISATKGRNYFDQYTGEGKVFYFLRNENLPEDHKLKKIAFVYDQDSVDTGDAYEVYDAEDTQIDMDEALDGIKDNIFGENIADIIAGDLKIQEEDKPLFKKYGISDDALTDMDELGDEVNEIAYEKWGDIRNEMLAHLEENQPGAAMEEQMEKIQEAFDQKAKHFHVNWDETGDGGYYFRGGVYFDFDELDWAMSNAEDDIKRIVEGVLDDNYIYPEYIEVEETNDGYRVIGDINPDYDEPQDPSGFETYAERVLEYDAKYEDMVEEMKGLFLSNGLLESETFDYLSALKDDLEGRLQNFGADFRANAVDIGRSVQFDLAKDLDYAVRHRQEKGEWKVQGRTVPSDELNRWLKSYLETSNAGGFRNVFELIFEDAIREHIKPEMQQMFLPGFEKEKEAKGSLHKQLDTILKNFFTVGLPKYNHFKKLYSFPVNLEIPYSVGGEKLDQKYGVEFAKLLIKVAEILDEIYPLAYKTIKRWVAGKFEEAVKRTDKDLKFKQGGTNVSESKKRFKIRILKS